ncbi:MULTISPECIES: F0F1 ATP synthase subunit A [Cyanophyceae]|uniref:ATP synthase subunit a 2 n=1 Tax=Picosynechococcus sp. (strain ATCC 27264 / PCC 7002 / PR-6) TaxID=32049 RepID=ATP62_PICP2|nr:MULTISPECIES: F0F1 ATP synthase subunit A [Cyanophyceae]B1XRK3.1 RecName: Full=ATP synthase subunit a 2; AltName: Full=ATP synthase F0 sector subunit a 2; AltName: Full=F-ATPase subunit 6 2 [Picosynechococcus sp. PCC 7002]ACB01188.1 ATP synthase F0, A subunit [Picosynechococcus sp. PCC 7002]ANV92214.1 F0F1 ATP synthase subunit A [Picosynechococcus sp. PCC 8807]QCS51018.1 ATP synthase subunit a 2 [Picosynechococcus sp. PCC 11901]SMH48054.1 ATP synthase F0 subcomplex A subunit [Picosynechococ
MQITPDNIIFYQYQFVVINATLVYTWLTMALLVIGAAWVTKKLVVRPKLPPWQNFLEIVVDGIYQHIAEVTQQEPEPYLAFVGTLFLFILTANLLTVVPGYQAPTGSLSTTTALAIAVFIAVPIYGIRQRGILGYLKSYLQPTPIMLPFQIIGEFSRTLALAVRLFGNIMSGNLLAAILLALVPLFVPVAMNLLGLVFGVIQAYVFAILALVYIASAATVQEKKQSISMEENS